MGEDRQAPAGWHDSADLKWRPPSTPPPRPAAAVASTEHPKSGPHGVVEPPFVTLLVESAALRAPIVAALDAKQLVARGRDTLPKAAVIIAEAEVDPVTQLAEIRRTARPDAAVLLVLTQTSAADVAAAHSAGAFACLRPPLVVEEILGLVTSALDSLSAKVQVAQLARQLHIHEHLASIGRMSAGLSHEIGGPLGAAALNMEVIYGHVHRMIALLKSMAYAPRDELEKGVAHVRAELDASDSFSELEAALGDTVEAHERMKNVLHMMRGLVGRVRDVRNERVDLERSVEDTKHALAKELEGVAVEVIAEPAFALADETLLGQMLLNLTTNAASAAKVLPSPRVRLHSYRSADAAIVSVRDNGPGIPVELQEKIFEPFFTTRRAEGGTGLGLAMCREYALRMGAELSVWSVPGRGACFRIFLPAFAG